MWNLTAMAMAVALFVPFNSASSAADVAVFSGIVGEARYERTHEGQRGWLARPSARDEREPSGIKGWLVKQATQLLATAIRHGGDSVAYVLKYLDKKAARTFRTHAKSIARELEKIADIPDLTTRIVKEKLEVFLRVELKVSGGTSLQIADAVKAALDILLF